MAANAKRPKAETAQTAEPKPWERQPAESAKAFAAFRLYCEMGAERTTLKVAKHCQRSASLMRKWARTHGWSERARALDVHLDTVRRAEEDRRLRTVCADWAERAIAVRESDWQDAQTLRQMVREKLAQFAGKVTLTDLIRALELASKLERQSCGLSSDEGGAPSQITVKDSQVVFKLPPNYRDVPESAIPEQKPDSDTAGIQGDTALLPSPPAVSAA